MSFGRRVGLAGQRLARSKAEAVAPPPRGRSDAASVVLPVRNRVPADLGYTLKLADACRFAVLDGTGFLSRSPL